MKHIELMLFKLIIINSSFRDPNLRLNCADLRVTPRTGLAASHELVGGLELSGLFADPVTDREPIVHCRFEVHI